MQINHLHEIVAKAICKSGLFLKQGRDYFRVATEKNNEITHIQTKCKKNPEK